MILPTVDPTIANLIEQEEQRQHETLMLIPSENYASQAVREAVGSVLTNKYSEGYPKKRYYQGNAFVDEIETLAIERAKEVFAVPFANVQPYSGSPANTAIYFALLQPGDTIMGLKLSGGGHLTHGHPEVTFSGKFFRSVQFDVNEKGVMDFKIIETLAKQEKPKLLMIGTTAYPRLIDWERFRHIANMVGAYLVADVSHLSGLLAAHVIPTPVPYADVVMMTTHKSLRGPRGAIILVTERGMNKDPEMGERINKAIMPGLQGGPHNNVTAGIAVALLESQTKKFTEYALAILENAQVLSAALTKQGYTITTGGTDTHLLVLDLRPQQLTGAVVAYALEVAGIVVNSNTVPHDPNPPLYPSGIRIGTPAVSARGMRAKEMKQIADWIDLVVKQVAEYKLPETKSLRSQWLKTFKEQVSNDRLLLNIAKAVKKQCAQFKYC